MYFHLRGAFFQSLDRTMRFLTVLLLVVCGCTHLAKPLYRNQSQSYSEARLPVVRRDELLDEIHLYYGVRYLEGGCSLTGVDCSCLVRLVFGAIGVRLPRTVKEQYGCGLPLTRAEVMTGDLIFFGKGGVPTHVGIALSNSELIHASRRGVVVDRIDDVVGAMGLVGARRVARIR